MSSVNFAEASAKLAAIRRELEASEEHELQEAAKRKNMTLTLSGVFRTDAEAPTKSSRTGSVPLGWRRVNQTGEETPAQTKKRATAEAKEVMALWDRTLDQGVAKQKEIQALGKNIPFGYDYKMSFAMEGETPSDRAKEVRPQDYQTATLVLTTTDKFGYPETVASFKWDRDSGKWSAG